MNKINVFGLEIHIENIVYLELVRNSGFLGYLIFFIDIESLLIFTFFMPSVIYLSALISILKKVFKNDLWAFMFSDCKPVDQVLKRIGSKFVDLER